MLKISELDFITNVPFSTMNVVEFVDIMLRKVNAINAVMNINELYSFLGTIISCKDFVDHDGQSFDVSFSSIKLLEKCTDSTVISYSKRMQHYIMCVLSES